MKDEYYPKLSHIPSDIKIDYRINLVGAGIFDFPWTKKRKRELLKQPARCKLAMRLKYGLKKVIESRRIVWI
ncbi:MAG: hypothetical protein ACRYE9_02425 [Janthinobacterium lividum]